MRKFLGVLCLAPMLLSIFAVVFVNGFIPGLIILGYLVVTCGGLVVGVRLLYD